MLFNRKNDAGIRHISDLSVVFIETMKEIASRGNDISREEINRVISKRRDVKQLLERAAAGTATKRPTGQSGDVSKIQAQLDETDHELQSTLHKLNEIQKKNAKLNNFNKRMMLTLLSLCHVGANERYFDQLDRVKSLVVDDAHIDDLENAFDELKNNMLRTEMPQQGNRAKAPQKRSLFSRLMGDKDTGAPTPEPEPEPQPVNFGIENVKRCYTELVEELKNFIDSEYARELDDSLAQVKESDDIEFILSLRSVIVSVIERSFQRINSEKADVALFIKEIGERLVALEKGLDSTSATVAEYNREDEDFNRNIEMQIKEVNVAIHETDDLTELRNLVISRLNHVAELLADKREDYHARIAKAEDDRSKLMKNLEVVIGDLQEQNRILEEQNRIDPLTGISNRRAFEERIAAELERYKRYNTNFSVLFFDIDHFKCVNDQYGHSAGDRALRGIAQCAASALRKTDMLARYGGEEFVAILPETSLANGVQVAQKLHTLVQDTDFDYDGCSVPITVSVGVTEVKDSDKDAGTIIDRADDNMYQAKQNGRNNVVSDNDK